MIKPMKRERKIIIAILHITNSELGFDYLRDNMKYSKEDMVQRDTICNS